MIGAEDCHASSVGPCSKVTLLLILQLAIKEYPIILNKYSLIMGYHLSIFGKSHVTLSESGRRCDIFHIFI